MHHKPNLIRFNNLIIQLANSDKIIYSKLGGFANQKEINFELL